MIKLLIGPYRTGKTGILLKELVDYKRNNPLDRVLVLVPSHRYGRLLRQQLLEQAQPTGAAGLFGLQVATIYESARRILTQAGLAPNILPREICVRVVGDVLRRMHAEKQLVHLDAIHDLPGTAAALFRLIDEFERAAITPSEATKCVNATASIESWHHELASIYRNYWLRLDQLGGLDEKRMVFSCRELLSRNSVPGLNVRYLIADGFDRISPLQAELMQGLSEHAAETRIAFDYVTPGLRAQASEKDDEYSWKDASYAELARRLPMTETFVSLPGPPTRPQASVFSALDLFAECQEAARRCKQAIVERSVSPAQILVVARDIKEYACAIEISFKQAGLPIFADDAVDVVSVPLIKTLLQALELSINDFTRRSVLDVLRSPYINTDRFGWTAVHLDRLERHSLRADLISGSAQWQLAFAEHEQLARGLERFFSDVTPPATAVSSAYCLWLEDMLETVLLPFSTRQPGGKDRRRQAIVLSESDVHSLAGLRDALKTLIAEEKLFGCQVMTFEAFHSNLKRMLDGASFRGSRPAGDCIYVSSAEQAPNRRFEEVFVLGTSEGRFPKHSAEAGFASADERSRWRMYGLVLNNPREEPGYEKALFASLTDRARQRFHASFPQVNQSGDEVFPSFYLSDGTLKADCDESAAGDGRPVEKVDVWQLSLKQPLSPSEAAFGWLWRKQSCSLPDNWSHIGHLQEYWSNVSSTVYGAYQRHAPDGSGDFRGDLSSLSGTDLFEIKTPPVWSVSALNCFGQCPFRYWVERSLGVHPVEEPEPGLDSKERGLLYHRILELYYRNLMAAGWLPPECVHDSVMQEALQISFGEVEKRPYFRPGPYWPNQKNEMAFRVKNFLAFDCQRLQKGGRVPALLEASFGMPDSQYGALRCASGGADVFIRGVIDRVDVERQGDLVQATVIDYKSGSTNISADDARAGANMQLPIYALAVEQSIIAGSVVDQGAYLAIAAAKTIGALAFKEGKTKDVLEKVLGCLQSTVEGVAAGKFTVQPYAAKACQYCDHKSVCRIQDLPQLTDKDEHA